MGLIVKDATYDIGSLHILGSEKNPNKSFIGRIYFKGLIASCSTRLQPLSKL